jgi:aconitate hydratase
LCLRRLWHKAGMQPKTFALSGKLLRYMPLANVPGIDALPFSLRILLENLLRQHFFASSEGGDAAMVAKQIDALMHRRVGHGINFKPARVFGQDILGLVMLVDLAAMRDAVAQAGGDPASVSPKVPVDIIIDHSLQVDRWAHPDAQHVNLAQEYARNGERFAFLRWCSGQFAGVRVVPPGKGIMHQIHLEYIGQVVWVDDKDGHAFAVPDTCVGTDSHTPMVNGLGILGWGVGGIEAEAVMLGKPISMALPEVVGFEVTGRLAEGVLPTDMVLAITALLRKTGVVGRFVEFFGAGLEALSLGDRGMIANMAPEYGATAVYFPIDATTTAYLRMTGRDEAHVQLVEQYARAQKLWRDAKTPVPAFELTITLDLGSIVPCIAGPRNPEDHLPLAAVPQAFVRHHEEIAGRPLRAARRATVTGERFALFDGAVVIAAITSCTNTANPANMMAAGLVAQKATARGLRTQPWVKTSLVPGSQVTADVLERAGLQASLDALGFHVAGFGCTTCNGGSGPLPGNLVEAIEREKLLVTAVLSGNRNFEGRIHPNVRAAYLASPALVIAYALAGTMSLDLTCDALGHDAQGMPVFLRDIWPTAQEITAAVAKAYQPELFRKRYAALFDGGEAWDKLAAPCGQALEKHVAPNGAGANALFAWQAGSTYLRRPPYFAGLAQVAPDIAPIVGMRPLAVLGDSVTTDHISPSGAISLGTPAADFLLAHGVQQADFNNYTTRRGNHEVAVRATFANIRLRNHMVPGVEGGMTRLMPEGTPMRIFEAAQEYLKRGVPLAVVAGNNYGAGSSRDWAAKGVALLGVKAVIAQGFERIHRTNLVGMGVLPLQFLAGESAARFGLDGSEQIDLPSLPHEIGVGTTIHAVVRYAGGVTKQLPLVARFETDEELHYWRHGGILPLVLRERLICR